MKKQLLVAVAALAAVVGNANAQIPVTDIAQIGQSQIQHALEYANMAAQYAKQIEQYTTQVQQMDLQKIAGKVLNTSQFGDSLQALEHYKSAYDMDSSARGINGMQTSQDFLGQFGGSSEAANQAYLRQLDAATDSKYALTKQTSNLAAARMNSVEADKATMKQLQTANANAEGQMQAAQVGNHIQSETLGQLVKMREEAAITAQMEAERRRIELEEEAARKAAWEAEKARMDQNRADRMQSNGTQSY